MEIMQYLTEVSANGMDALEFLFASTKDLMTMVSSANVPEWFPMLCSISIGTAILMRRR